MSESDPTLDRGKKNIKVISEGKTKIISTYYDDKVSYNSLVKIETKNILTANDAMKKNSLNIASDKTNQTCSIFRLLEDNNIPTSFIKQLDSFNFVSKHCTMLPYECVIRRRAYGSFLKRHPEVQSGKYFHTPVIEFFSKLAYSPPCLSHENIHAILDSPRLMDENKAREYYLRDGQWIHSIETDPMLLFNFHEWRLKGEDKNSKDGFKLDVYSAKKPQNHDEKLMQIDSSITVQEYMDIVDLMKRVFYILENSFQKNDVELIDLKIEVGYGRDCGKLMVSDVIDNDSWRIWPDGDRSKQLDKQSYRDGEDLDLVLKKYNEVTDLVRKLN